MKSCLVVDDSMAVRKIARRIMEALNFTVDEAEDGRIALDLCDSAMPDAILLDWNMPVMNGLDFLRALRRRTGGNRPIVVFCTSRMDITHVQEAISAGADEYIMKPFDSVIVQRKLVSAGVL